MALVLGMELGQAVLVGKTRVVLHEIKTPKRFLLKVESGWAEQLYEVSDKERTEILPNVFAQAGLGGNPQVIKVAFEADRNILILREKLALRGEINGNE